MSDPLPACPGGQAAPRLEPRGRPTEFANYWHSVGVAVGDSPKAPHYASQKPPPDEEWCPWNNPHREIRCPPTGTSPVRGQGDELSASREIPVTVDTGSGPPWDATKCSLLAVHTAARRRCPAGCNETR